MHAVAELESVVEIAAPPAVVWALVSDVRRMHEWSPQVESTRFSAGWDEVRLGTRFTNRNSLGELTWTTHAEVVRLTPGAELAFRIDENWVVWSFSLEPTAAGTRLTQRRTAPDGISELSHELTEGFMGGQASFTATLHAGMATTLAGIKAAAESTPLGS